ncbi:unnamed protein product [Vitrella brassicaformis CCMP3155]|uniref:VOC domain-containing protein n=1 Tax=Vitrella brassicaformis (strain CCMP3155) TaxID=1169540 RepID=A0A0G4EHT2_VITBC|nr:unnamed protein product [Vitrella brassicaformis CCMP3155]|eukprot:CEL95464.1 unnamed protein product [Vitrella brassicaformis CCMP3155]
MGTLPETQNLERYIQHAVVNVPKMDDALNFYTRGLGMRVIRTRTNPAKTNNVTFVGYGPETLDLKRVENGFRPGISSYNEYGAHFTLELIEKRVPPELKSDDEDAQPVVQAYEPGNGVQFLQIALPFLRVSQLAETGGNIRRAYGWIEVDAPGGLPLRIIIGERRDPFMFACFTVKDLSAAKSFYETRLGMRELPYQKARYNPDSPLEPKQPQESAYMGYSEDTFGLLLVQQDKKIAKKTPIEVGSVFDKLAILSRNVVEEGPSLNAGFTGPVPGIGTNVAAFKDAQGYGLVLVEYDDFEKELSDRGYLYLPPSFSTPADDLV